MLATTDVRFRTFPSTHRDYMQQFSPLNAWNWPNRQVSPTTSCPISPYTVGFPLPAPTAIYPTASPYTTAWMQTQALRYSQMQWMNIAQSTLGSAPTLQLQAGDNSVSQNSAVAVNEWYHLPYLSVCLSVICLSECISVCHFVFTIFNPYLCTQNCYPRLHQHSDFVLKTVSLSNTDNMSTHVNTDNNDAWHLLLVNAGHFKSILFHEHVTLTLNLYFTNKLHYSSPILSNEIRMCKTSECIFCEHSTILEICECYSL